MTGSAFHKAMAQDAVRLSQMTGTKGWVAGLSKALQAAGYAFQPQHLHSINHWTAAKPAQGWLGKDLG